MSYKSMTSREKKSHLIRYIMLTLSAILIVLNMPACGLNERFFYSGEKSKQNQNIENPVEGEVPVDQAYQLNITNLALYKKAQRFVTAGKYGQALKTFDELWLAIENKNNVYYEAKILFWKGYCSEKLLNVVNAINFYKQIIQNYPDQPVSEEAARRLKNLT